MTICNFYKILTINLSISYDDDFEEVLFHSVWMLTFSYNIIIVIDISEVE